MSRRSVPFWERVDKADADECWLWTGATTKGYGRVWHDGRMQYAHRVAWERTKGRPVPSHLEVCHRCDTPLCCNPRHLFIGTHADNMRDMAAKGRAVNVGRKLDDDDCADIRRLRKLGTSALDIANAYGVTRTHVYGITNGKRRSASGAAS